MSFQGLEEYTQLLKWIAKAKLKNPFTIQTVYCSQFSEEVSQGAGVLVGDELHGGVWNQETWNGEVQNMCAVAPEAATPLLEANLWNGDREDQPENILLVNDPMKINDSEGVS
jgi:hypothetical protein